MLTYLQSQQASGFLSKLMLIGWGLREFLEPSEHDSPLAVVWQSDAAKGFGRLASVAMLGVGKVPAAHFEGVAGLLNAF